MSLRNYGVLKGRPINKRFGTGRSQHYSNSQFAVLPFHFASHL
jgi:uncharacterized protein YukJ